MQSPPALLTIAHGTRDPRGGHEMDQLLGHLRARLSAPVENAWLEDFAEPDPVTAAGRLVAQGVTRLVTVPFLVFGAGHAKTDVPAGVHEVRAAFPEVLVQHSRVLGLHPDLFTLARARIAAVRSGPVPDDEVLLVTGSGSTDPDANGDLWKAARFLAEGTGHRWVEAAFAGVTWPTVDVVLRRIAAAGAKRVLLFSWSLLAGLLEQRVAAWAKQVAEETALGVVDAGRFGPDPVVADVLLDRYREVLEGDPRMNCDLCAYRLPLPGLERRVAAPSAGGTGKAVRAANPD
jgi:sirohydrochlorin cobaltochelatase